MNLTPRQLQILTKIRDYRVTKGYSPTMQQLANDLGVSKVTVFEHVEALIKKGALQRDANKARSLRLSPNLQLPDESKKTRLPLVGTIAAGIPIEAVEQREHLDLEELFTSGHVHGDNTFVLRVRGESMIDEHIQDGDYVVCQRRNTARNGETVVAIVDNDEATLKTLFHEKSGQIRLQPANDNFEPIIVDPNRIQIQGTVIGVIRTY
ncbi:LexA repressor [Poriferisphaera corsica]|uniref:LexA repressor n=2 Tax=Poriferisphaera corsica TaxID=2528020 RepID=A0A517YQ63_9BACT|nr:transcriptional repressor LexA [Poriferisphaera corsica]QDU32351.1 LexA repressor [Poriferisphaera corsica]